MGHVHKLFIVYAKSHASERERERERESISCPVTQSITEFRLLSAS
jgi:hypothetical protein